MKIIKEIFSLLMVLINFGCINFNQKSVKNIVSENFFKIVVVIQKQHKCSGFYIQKNIIATAGHCVTDAEDNFLIIKNYDGKEFFAILLAKDKEKDIAFLITDELGIPLELTEENSFGERIIVIRISGIFKK